MGNVVKKVRAFLGLDLKKRDTPLNFKFPLASHRVQAKNVLGLSFHAHLNREQDDPSAYFELIKARVKHLNRCALSTRQREKLTGEITTLFYEKALQISRQSSQTAGIPENDDRKRLLVVTSKICQILIVSNQILFDKYYNSSNFIFERSRKKFKRSGLIIFELFLLNQRLKGLRYQKPENSEWAALHTVLITLKLHDDISHPQATLKHQLKIESPKSINTLFVSLVIFDYFKPLQWPTHLQWVIESYLNSVTNPVDVLFCDSAYPAGHDAITVYGSGNIRHSVVHPDTSPKPIIMLDCGVLFSQIRSDCMALITALQSKQIDDIPLRFAKFKENERLVISHKLLHGMDHSEPYDLDNKNDQLHDLRLFVGFSEVFALLHHQQGEFAHEERLADALAKRSAVIAQDDHSGNSTRWTLLYENATHIRLSTQESSYTTPMKIGSLLAYGIGESIKKPSLAVVSRIERTTEKTVILDFEVISKYAESVVVTRNHVGKNVGNRGILISSQKKSSQWGLLVQPMDVLCGVDEFSMYRKKEVLPLHLETLKMATTDFSLFSIPLSASQLGLKTEAGQDNHDLSQST